MVSINIEDVIPHRKHMRLVEQVVLIEDDRAVTRSVVLKNWPLFQNRCVSPLVMIELVAQTAAACIGWKDYVKKGKSRGKGWLVGIKKASFNMESIPLDANIETRARIRFNLDYFTEIEGSASIISVPGISDSGAPEEIGTVALQVLRSEEG